VSTLFINLFTILKGGSLMLRKCFFTVAATVAAALVLGGCARTIKDARFRVVELSPVSQDGVETVADLQVLGTKKVIGTAKGFAKTPEQENDLGVQALESALASDPSGPDVLVAPSYFYVRDYDELTVTVVGYPARYKNFRQITTAGGKGKQAFSVKQLPGGASVISYDKTMYTVKIVNDNMIAVQAIQGNGQQKPVNTGSETSNTTTTTETGE
jgi:hypothetical protein